MPMPEVENFFQGFTFDTLLALISCIAGVIALFIGGTAHNRCREIENSFNDKKKFEDNSQDHSQRAAGDIINNNGITEAQLMTITTALTEMSNNNFSKAVDQAYATFRLQTDENMKHIILEAERIVKEAKWQIAGYTKIDWINIYFESAKNTSDPYMQEVWAKVLAMEMAAPGTFSFKTLDVLKNLSSKEFGVFEKLVSIEIHHAIIKGDYLDALGLDWGTLQRLKDFGLISLDGSQRTVVINSKDLNYQLIHQSHVLAIKNDNDEKKELKSACYLLTVPAQELLPIVTARCTDEAAIRIADATVKADTKKQFAISLHKLNWILPDGHLNYQSDNLLGNQ